MGSVIAMGERKKKKLMLIDVFAIAQHCNVGLVREELFVDSNGNLSVCALEVGMLQPEALS